jgi:hypothetical protein
MKNTKARKHDLGRKIFISVWAVSALYSASVLIDVIWMTKTFLTLWWSGPRIPTQGESSLNQAASEVLSHHGQPGTVALGVVALVVAVAGWGAILQVLQPPRPKKGQPTSSDAITVPRPVKPPHPRCN